MEIKVAWKTPLFVTITRFFYRNYRSVNHVIVMLFFHQKWPTFIQLSHYYVHTFLALFFHHCADFFVMMLQLSFYRSFYRIQQFYRSFYRIQQFYRSFHRIQRICIVFDAFVSEYRFFYIKNVITVLYRNYGTRPWPLFCSG